MKKGSVLVVDDNKNVLSALRILFEGWFAEVTLLSSPANLASTLRSAKPDVVLLDMNFSSGINTGNEGLYWLSEIRKTDPEIPVVLFTAYADIELAVRALKEGATDFVVKPWDNAKLMATMRSAMELRKSKNENRRLREKQDILTRELNREEDIYWGSSRPMQELLRLIGKIASTDANVLITGENGTGKELIAKKIHAESHRNNGPIVTVDMGAITETLFESELFGHVKGAFTDAVNDRAGKFEAADRGTLFLDEIGNLSYTMQAKLLSALQSRQVTRVGSNKPIRVDIRLISATNKDLAKLVDEENFREDLLYRINTIQVEVPPLRDRQEDIEGLAHFFMTKLTRKYGKEQLTLSPSTLEKMRAYPWPGNVRELQHAIEKAVILADGDKLTPDDFYFGSTAAKLPLSEPKTLDQMEKALIQKALQRHNRNLSAVAAQLGITRPTLYNKMKKYDLQ